MVQVLQHGNWKKEKGLSLIETVISLSVIVIISIAAFSAAIFASNAKRKLNTARYFIHLVDDTLELYQNYEDTQFEKAFKKLTNQDITYNSDHVYYLNKNYEYVTEIDHDYVYRLDFNNPTLSISATYSDGEEIFTRSASK